MFLPTESNDGRLQPTLVAWEDLRLPTPGIFSSAAKMSSPLTPPLAPALAHAPPSSSEEMEEVLALAWEAEEEVVVDARELGPWKDSLFYAWIV